MAHKTAKARVCLTRPREASAGRRSFRSKFRASWQVLFARVATLCSVHEIVDAPLPRRVLDDVMRCSRFTRAEHVTRSRDTCPWEPTRVNTFTFLRRCDYRGCNAMNLSFRTRPGELRTRDGSQQTGGHNGTKLRTRTGKRVGTRRRTRKRTRGRTRGRARG